MLFAGLAASAAVDLLSLLQPQKPKDGPGLKAQPAFEVADLAAVQPLPVASAGSRNEDLSREALDTLLSAQGGAGQRKKRATSVLLELMQSSQNGSVRKSEFEGAAGEGASEGAELFDRMDQNGDRAVNVAELSAFLDTYRRTSDGVTQGKARALAVVV
jgi:hypothetical protein